MVEQTPGWHPDPSGRHEHRFWDGSSWTASVADAGVVTVDQEGATAEPGATAELPRIEPDRAARRRRRWRALAGVAAALLVVVVAVALSGTGSGSGTGPSMEDLTAGGTTARRVHLQAGEAVGFEVRAERNEIRFRAAIALDADASGRLRAAFGSDTGGSYAASDYQQLLPGGRDGQRLLYAGRTRGFFAESFVAPVAGTYTLAVQADSAARLRLDIETQAKPGLAGAYTPLQLYRLRRDPAYRAFFTRWDRRSQGDVGAFTDFSDPYSDSGGSSDQQYSDYLSEYSDYMTGLGSSS